MRRALTVLISLYPKPWRDRYRNEFEALLDDVSPTWRTLFDVLGGAMKMQFKIWSPWKMIAAFGVVGVISAAIYSWTIPARYVSGAVLRVEDGQTSLPETILSRRNLTQVIIQADLYKDLRARMPLEEIVEQLKTNDLTIRPAGSDAKSFVIYVAAPDAGRAQRATQILAADFVNENAKLIDPASLPVNPVGPRPSRNIVMGLVAGLLLGSIIALFNGLGVWKLAALLGIAGGVAGAVVGFVLPDRFSTTAVFVLQFDPADEDKAGAHMRQILEAVTSDASLHGIVQQFNLYPGESGAERRLREHLHIEPVANSAAIRIRFDDKDRYAAQKVVVAVMQKWIDESVHGNRHKLRETLQLVEPPSLPAHPYSPNRPVVAGGGFFFGLIAAVGVGLWRYLRAPLPAVAAQ
jgi:capsular polysaccharide biosynthesis protein